MKSVLCLADDHSVVAVIIHSYQEFKHAEESDSVMRIYGPRRGPQLKHWPLVRMGGKQSKRPSDIEMLGLGG